MSYNRYYQGPDYLPKLKEIYARQSRQLQEDLQNKIEHSKQVAEADPDVTKLELTKATLDVVAKLAPLAGKVAKGLSDKAKKDKQKAYNKKSITDKRALSLGYRAKADGLNLEDEGTLNKLKDQLAVEYFGVTDWSTASPEIQTEVTNILTKTINLTPSDYVRNQEFSAREAVARYTKEDYIKAIDGNPTLMAQWENADAVDKVTIQRNWIEDNLETLGYSKGMGATLSKEIDRILGVTATTGKTKATVKAAAGKVNRDREQLITALNTEGVPAANEVFNLLKRRTLLKFDIPDGLTAKQQATESLTGDLYNLGKERRLTEDQFNNLLDTSLVDTDGKSLLPDGFTNLRDFYFDKEGSQYRHVLSGIRQGANLTYNELVTLGEKDYANYYVQAERGQLDQAGYDNAVGRLLSLPLKNSKAKLEALERVFTNDQSKETSAKVLVENKNKIELGLLTQADVDKETNVVAKRLLETAFKQQEEAKTNINLEKVLAGIVGDVEKGKRGPYGTAGASSPTQQVSADQTNFFKRDFYGRVRAAIARKEIPDYTQILRESRAELALHRKANGWGIDDLNHPEAGKYSIDGPKGDYTNFSINYEGVRSMPGYNNSDAKFTVENVAKWDAGYADMLKLDRKTRFEKPNGIYTNGMLGYFAETGQVTEQMKRIAKLNNLNISRALGYAIDAKLGPNASDADKIFAKNFNIAKLNTKDRSDEVLLGKAVDSAKVLKGFKNDDLLKLASQARRLGFDSLSRNEVLRYISYLGRENPQVESMTIAEKEARILELKKIKAEKNTRIMEGIQETEDERRSPGFGSDANPASSADYETDYI